MTSPVSIFFDISLPNASTWFYFSLLLACALFFKFNRFLSFRNLDILSIFFFMPGFLLLLEGGHDDRIYFSWLLLSCLFWIVRCLLDLVLERRPAFKPNLNVPGMLLLAFAFYFSLVAVAVREPNLPDQRETRPQTPIDKIREHGEKIIENRGGAEVDVSKLRLWVERGLTLFCHLLIAVGLILVCWFHYDDYHLGFACATLYFLLPYTYLMMPYTGLKIGRWDHSWLMALMIWALVFHNKPIVSGILMGLSFGSLFFPLVLLPLWFSYYHDKGIWRFVIASMASFVVSSIVFILAYGGNTQYLASTWMISDWITWKEPMTDTQSFWHGVHWAYRLPVFILYAVIAISVYFWPTPKTLGNLIALSAALLIGIQFWYAHMGGVYILWYLPLLILVVFRPSILTQPKSLV